MQINPNLHIVSYNEKLNPVSAIEYYKDCDILAEAFDKAESKKWLIETWLKDFKEKPVISGNGLSGTGNLDKLKVRKIGNLYLCGDGVTDMTMGLSCGRVVIVAAMQAETIIDIVLKGQYLI